MDKCKQCGGPVEIIQGRRAREYCSDACRQRHHRAKNQKPHQDYVALPKDDAQANMYTTMLAELVELREQNRQQAIQLVELELEISRLRSRLDIERRFLSDTKPYTFRAWLGKQPGSDFSRKVLADPLFPARGSRALYQAHANRLHCTEEELADFVRLWKLMLLQS